MKIISIRELPIPAVKIVRFARFADGRGYFTEPYRHGDLAGPAGLADFAAAGVVQANESRSRPGVIRGLHFQWNPFMGKLVRTLDGRMLDLILDIRKDSPSLGKIIAVDMPAREEGNWDEWLWIPPGFAHGNLFLADTRIEYLCTGEYSPGCEAGISPFAEDLDWSLADPEARECFREYVGGKAIISEKDAKGLSLGQWLADPRSKEFSGLWRG
ncbi:MAG: dTDP-4-dehydrorhamnose 3,5-epimerase family protein [Planctomycetota bacterium]|jgi:dTDP-4-dehydrorhamnose 3,5-epimerase|nr:dTDP-4-dehydrorhamnose 3,5-epimerase family protein [Planctomycetota bacterium]